MLWFGSIFSNEERCGDDVDAESPCCKWLKNAGNDRPDVLRLVSGVSICEIKMKAFICDGFVKQLIKLDLHWNCMDDVLNIERVGNSQ